jgi:hypothetical protein
MTASLEQGESKVFELLEGGAAQSGRPEGESSISLREGATRNLVMQLSFRCRSGFFFVLERLLEIIR